MDYMSGQKQNHPMNSAGSLYYELMDFFSFKEFTTQENGVFYVHIKRSGDELRKQKPYVGEIYLASCKTYTSAAALETLFDMGAEKIVAAIGPSIGECCYQVGEDMRDSVASLQGADFASRHVKERDGSLYANVSGINEEIMREAGVSEIDVLSECTACKPWLYHSHRATGGKRGTMAAVIGLN